MTDHVLRSLTTMRIGGACERLVRLKDLKDLSENLPKPIRILGNGSNVLIDDHGLKGSVIVVRDFPPSEPEIVSSSQDHVLIRASGGIFLPSLCRWAERNSLSGCEYMIGIPGTLGGAVVQNAGANEQELKDIFVEGEVFDLETHRLLTLSAKQADFAYRTSALKQKPNWIVVSALLKLHRASETDITTRIQKNLDYRKQKTPYSKPSLGSTFTRIPRDGGDWHFPGELIERVGLKGLQSGGARISPVHANYIVNEGGATFDDVMSLIKKIESEVFQKLGIRMHREILFWSDRDPI